jgi:pimeloyl-ACP methyl ester carboxylesterase
VTALELSDVSLHYEQSGHGPDILWLAAGDNPGANWRRWQTPAFDERYRSTTYDARGVGATVSRGEPPWSMERHAEDAAALIERVCEPPVALVGLSMGSLIAQHLACTRPELVRLAATMGTCVSKRGFIREWERAEIDLRLAGHELPPDFALVHYALLLYPAEVLGDDDTWARLKPLVAADFSDRDGRMLAAQWEACLEYDSSELLPACQVELHAIAFEQDVQTPPARVREVAELAPHGTFHLVPGCGHGSAFGHRPSQVNALLASILEGD